MFNSNYSRHSDDDIKKMKVSELKYNIARQELYLQFLKDMGILCMNEKYDKKRYVNAKTKNYKFFIEEAQIPALSICRLLRESGIISSYLYSPNYDVRNPFDIVGFNGHLLVYNWKTMAVGFDRELGFGYRGENYSFRHTFDKLPYGSSKTLIFIQGQPERAFSLIGSEYDTAFGDVYDSDDVETKCMYDELYCYMEDYYSNKTIAVRDYEISEDGKEFRLIYCPKDYCPKKY